MLLNRYNKDQCLSLKNDGSFFKIESANRMPPKIRLIDIRPLLRLFKMKINECIVLRYVLRRRIYVLREINVKMHSFRTGTFNHLIDMIIL